MAQLEIPAIQVQGSEFNPQNSNKKVGHLSEPL